jgi:hypothetical protein
LVSRLFSFEKSKYLLLLLFLFWSWEWLTNDSAIEFLDIFQLITQVKLTFHFNSTYKNCDWHQKNSLISHYKFSKGLFRKKSYYEMIQRFKK